MISNCEPCCEAAQTEGLTQAERDKLHNVCRDGVNGCGCQHLNQGAWKGVKPE